MKTTPPHKFRNASRLVSSSDPSWTTAQSHGLIDISATATPDGKLVSSTGHEFLNLCSCSYLGLHRHPKILKAMKDVLEDGSQVHFSLSTVRIRPKVMDEAEELLGEIFGGHAILGLSASVLSASLLPPSQPASSPTVSPLQWFLINAPTSQWRTSSPSAPMRAKC